MQKAYRNGLSTNEHDEIDVQQFFSLVYQALHRHRHEFIIDLFAGGGRDIASFWKILNGEGKFVAIDADRQRVSDMLSKNGNSLVQFTEVFDDAELNLAFSQQKIAALQGELPDFPFGKTNIDLRGKAGFVLCNAGIMFVPPKDLEQTVAVLISLLGAQAEMFLRFSMERPDQRENKKYHTHDPSRVGAILERGGLKVVRNPDLPDPSGRPFSWVDLHVINPR